MQARSFQQDEDETNIVRRIAEVLIGKTGTNAEAARSHREAYRSNPSIFNRMRKHRAFGSQPVDSVVVGIRNVRSMLP